MTDVLINYLNSRPIFIDVIVWLSIFFTGIIILTFLYIVYLRVRLRLTQYESRKIRENWHPVFKALRQNNSVELPDIADHQKAFLLELWSEEQEIASPEYTNSLVNLAFQVGLDHEICRLLKIHEMVIVPRKIWLQSIAIIAARKIDTVETRTSLFVMAKSDNYYLSANACASLVAVQADGWEKEIISTLFRFPKHAPFIAVQLSQVGGASVLRMLEPFLDLLPSYAEMNFVSLVERTDDKTLLSLLIGRLRNTDSDEEKAAVLRALRRIGGETERQHVIPLLNHPNPILRIQAIKTLGTLGHYEDRVLLTPHLSDPDWWIRYRSARAYILLIGDRRRDLPEFIDSLTDRYARDIMRHAVAEIDWCMT